MDRLDGVDQASDTHDAIASYLHARRVASTAVQPVILSGGSGTRLWPLSRKTHPKQFLSVLGKDSLFQQTCLRLKDSLYGAPMVIANQAHRFLVAEQLRALDCEARIVLEPVPRNTAPAAIVAALLAAREDDRRLLLMLPSDHVVADIGVFNEAVRAGMPIAERGAIVTFGVEPTSPHTGYGYIDVAEGSGPVRAVNRFVEKPDAETAKQYLASGHFLWNAGIFLFTARTMLTLAERHCPDILATALEAIKHAESDLDFMRLSERHFAAAANISLDYAIIEKAKGIACVPLKAGWNDLGSWTEIWETGAKDGDGNTARGDVHFHKTHNSLAFSDHGALAVVGLDDVVVVTTRDATLVTSKEHAQSVKEIVAELEAEGREEAIVHSRVHRPWGWYERLALGDRFQVKCICVKPGAQLSLQSHYHRSEHWVVVSGTCEVTIGAQATLLSENQSTFVPINERHRLSNPGKIPVFLIEVQSGSYLGEDDIQRFEDVYGRAGS